MPAGKDDLNPVSTAYQNQVYQKGRGVEKSNGAGSLLCPDIPAGCVFLLLFCERIDRKAE